MAYFGHGLPRESPFAVTCSPLCEMNRNITSPRSSRGNEAPIFGANHPRKSRIFPRPIATSQIMLLTVAITFLSLFAWHVFGQSSASLHYEKHFEKSDVGK